MNTFKSAKAKEPFFLMFATHDIHVPRCPEKRFVGKSRHGVRGDVTVELDDCVRRITEALQQAGLEKDALVIFSSDQMQAADIDESGSIDSTDVYYLLYYIALNGAGVRSTWADVVK